MGLNIQEHLDFLSNKVGSSVAKRKHIKNYPQKRSHEIKKNKNKKCFPDTDLLKET